MISRDCPSCSAEVTVELEHKQEKVIKCPCGALLIIELNNDSYYPVTVIWWNEGDDN